MVLHHTATATTDDIEVRICLSEGPDNEDVIISLLDVYIM